MTAPTVTRRRWATWKERVPLFVDWRSGRAAWSKGEVFIPAQSSLGELLASLPVTAERVFVTGPRPGDTPDGLRRWMTDGAPEWATAPEGHYLEDADSFTLRFVGPAGRRVSIVRAAAWFGEGTYSARQALAAWDALRAGVADSFAGGVLLATPATTGRDLFVRGLGERVFHLADPEHQALIRSTTGQGRDQLLPAPSDAPAGGLWEYDGRFMYAACTWGLGSGVAHDHVATGPTMSAAMADEFSRAPYRRGRYQIDWRVPAGWDHVGLVGLWTEDGWRYPSRPGDSGTSWVDGAELLLLARYGWRFLIRRRLLLHEPDGAGPLDRWSKKLAALRASLVERGETLAAAGARSILLHAVGAFSGAPHRTTRTAPIDQPRAVPSRALDLRVEGDQIVWAEQSPTAWPELSHPEWSAAIWARCRARMLSAPGVGQQTGALHVPFDSVVAFRTDALYLASDPNWYDDGKVGRLRLVAHVPGPIHWPTSKRELLALKKEGAL